MADATLILDPVRDKTFSVYGRKLAAARRRAGLSQQTLATAIGRTVSAVSKIERQDVAHIFHRVRPRLVAALQMTDGEFEDRIVARDHSPATRLLAEMREFVLAGKLTTGEVIQNARSAASQSKAAQKKSDEKEKRKGK